jgi:apolipoprotein N-acyltransferase
MLEKYFDNRLLTLYLYPFILGSLTVFSYQPFNLIIINFIILPIFFYLVIYINKKSKSIYRKKPYKKNLLIFGILFGFGFYFSGISWIAHSLSFDDNFKILIPVALILIPLFLSLFFGISTLLVGPFLKPNFNSILIFSATLAVSDFLRTKLFTGFPWNLWAYSFSSSTEILQILHIVGLHSFNILAVTLFTAPAMLFFNISTSKKTLAILSLFSLILGLYVYGSYEINKNKRLIKSIKNKMHIKIISPNFKIEYGLSISEIENKFNKLIKYSNPGKDQKTLFIWPEGVFSGYNYNEILVFSDLIAKHFNKEHYIIFGVNKLDKKTGLVHNSLILTNNKLQILQGYNKRKLVPFGEFLPFENFFNKFGLKKITEGQGSFLKGGKQENIKINKLNILPLICYEVIFTRFVQKRDVDTNLIVNISEDGWFGNTIGPDQHYAKSIFRAIESGTFLLRSANKGTSAIIDNRGIVIKQLNRSEAGNIELIVPLIKSENNKNDLIFFVLLFTYFLIFKFYRIKIYGI